MTLISSERIRETTTTTGAGDIALAGAVFGYKTFASAYSVNGNHFNYHIDGGLEWEVGVGHLESTGLVRDAVISSSNSNALVSFSSGTKAVFVTSPATSENLLLSRIFGNGSAGDVTLTSGATTSTAASVMYNNLTLLGSAKLNSPFHPIYVSGILDLTNSNTDNKSIYAQGYGASAGTATAGGAASGTAAFAGNIGTGAPGSAGGAPSAVGANVDSDLAAVRNGGVGALGGVGSTGVAGGTLGTAGVEHQILRSMPFYFRNGGAGTSATPMHNTILGGQGSSGGGGAPGAGGGGGAQGGSVLILFANVIKLGVNSMTQFEASGRAGGAGFAAGSAGGGGGGGGGGGMVHIIYNVISGQLGGIKVSGGDGGAGGHASARGGAAGGGGYAYTTCLSTGVVTRGGGGASVASTSSAGAIAAPVYVGTWHILNGTPEELLGPSSFDTAIATADEYFEFGNWDETMASPIPATGVNSFTTATADEDFEFVNWDETLASPIPTTGVDSFTTATADEDFEFVNWDETMASPIPATGVDSFTTATADEDFDSGWT